MSAKKHQTALREKKDFSPEIKRLLAMHNLFQQGKLPNEAAKTYGQLISRYGNPNVWF